MFDFAVDALRSAVDSVEAAYRDAAPSLTTMAQRQARDAGWPHDAWRRLYVSYEDRGAYNLKYYVRDGDVDVVRSHEFGFDGDPRPAGRKFLNRVGGYADFVIAARERGELR